MAASVLKLSTWMGGGMKNDGKKDGYVFQKQMEAAKLGKQIYDSGETKK